MKGDSVNLSIAYIARMMLEEQALEYYDSYAHCCKLTAVRN